ncbi:hypothetical protein HZB96_04730 [Candidatus Gottesmanbacteria bacterium]|nr:hypothetical protein [Candidatus Gottesmanbacteria bacterium]
MFSKTTNKSVRNPWGDDHPEKIKGATPKTIGFSDQMKGLLSPDKMLSQLFGERAKGESIPQKAEAEKAIKPRETLLFSYERTSEDKHVAEETHVILSKLKEQIVLLEKSEKNLAAEVSKVKVEQLPKKSGIYYIRFLEWLITVVKQLRMRVEDGRAWLATFSERKKKRGYWKMYKKHGTTFGLSHERTLATQTG